MPKMTRPPIEITTRASLDPARFQSKGHEDEPPEHDLTQVRADCKTCDWRGDRTGYNEPIDLRRMQGELTTEHTDTGCTATLQF